MDTQNKTGRLHIENISRKILKCCEVTQKCEMLEKEFQVDNFMFLIYKIRNCLYPSCDVIHIEPRTTMANNALFFVEIKSFENQTKLGEVIKRLDYFENSSKILSCCHFTSSLHIQS